MSKAVVIQSVVKMPSQSGAILVHRSDIASVANALLNATDNDDVRKGIMLLALAFCDAK